MGTSKPPPERVEGRVIKHYSRPKGWWVETVEVELARPVRVFWGEVTDVAASVPMGASIPAIGETVSVEVEHGPLRTTEFFIATEP